MTDNKAGQVQSELSARGTKRDTSDTNDTSNTANSSDASASVTRLLSYFRKSLNTTFPKLRAELSMMDRARAYFLDPNNIV